MALLLVIVVVQAVVVQAVKVVILGLSEVRAHLGKEIQAVDPALYLLAPFLAQAAVVVEQVRQARPRQMLKPVVLAAQAQLRLLQDRL